MSKVSAIIVAGGTGSRMGTKIKKQYLRLKGKEVLVRTVEIFENHQEVDEIIVVTGEDDIEYVKRMLCETYQCGKIKVVVAGGAERQDSVYNGLSKIASESKYVIIHDGARPLVTPELITRALEEVYEKKAVVVAVPVKNTIKRVDANKKIIITPPREELWSVQTPQIFETSCIQRAYKQAMSEGYYGTDDSMLVEQLGESVSVVVGEYTNIKITTPEDLTIAETILEKKSKKQE